MRGDGNGWIRCGRGHRHWGRYGAAGLLITDGTRVVLQHRAVWTHDGGTWAFPGGARDAHEDVVTAALREAAEEAGLDPASVAPMGEWVDDHGGWSYTTVLARALVELELHADHHESDEVRWWAMDEVSELPLHRGFASAWPHLRDLLEQAPPGVCGHGGPGPLPVRSPPTDPHAVPHQEREECGGSP